MHSRIIPGSRSKARGYGGSSTQQVAQWQVQLPPILAFFPRPLPIFNRGVNLKTHRLDLSKCVTRTMRARMARIDWGNPLMGGRGAAGTSKEILEEGRIIRRIARTPPVELMLSRAQNSVNRFPCSSTPRAKTGIASGRRPDCLLSLLRPCLATVILKLIQGIVPGIYRC